MKNFFFRQREHKPISFLRKTFSGRVWLKVLQSIGWRLAVAFPIALGLVFFVHRFEKQIECQTIEENLPKNQIYSQEEIEIECELNHKPEAIIKVQNVEALAILLAGIIYLLEINKRVGEGRSYKC